MLANSGNPTAQIGSLARDIHLPETFFHELIRFVGNELPRWRDRADRNKAETSETILTSQLCAHLNSMARHSTGWDILQFRTEEPDETKKNRKIDLVAAPSGVNIWIDGRRHSDFDALLPIECKRLPTPNDAARDEREYVFSKFGSSGGVQRFKSGAHGSQHSLGAMIGYVQQADASVWTPKVVDWINGLISAGEKGWTSADHFALGFEDKALGLSIYKSTHARESLPDMRLEHLWIKMN